MKRLLASILTISLCALPLVSLHAQGQRNDGAATGNAARSVPGEILVQFRAGITNEDKGRALGRIGGEEVETIRTQAMNAGDRRDLVLVRIQPDVP